MTTSTVNYLDRLNTLHAERLDRDQKITDTTLLALAQIAETVVPGAAFVEVIENGDSFDSTWPLAVLDAARKATPIEDIEKADPDAADNLMFLCSNLPIDSHSNPCGWGAHTSPGWPGRWVIDLQAVRTIDA